MATRASVRIDLIFPPVWECSAPYLSTPALCAYLRSQGWDVVQRDVNLDFWLYFRKPDQVARMYAVACDAYSRLQSRVRPFTREVLELLVCESIHDLSLPELQELAATRALEPALFRQLVMLYGGIGRSTDLEQDGEAPDESAGLDYHDHYFAEISLSRHAQRTIDLLRLAAGDDNPYRAWFEANALPSIVNRAPAIVGLSIIAPNQAVPAFTLANLIREALPQACIVAGGPWCTHLSQTIASTPGLFRDFDGFVFGEGEIPLVRLAESIARDADLSEVPSLVWQDGQTLRMNELTSGLPMDELPTPDFDDLKLDDYDYPGHLPLLSSRGCYWGKCTFCSYPLIEPVYKTRRPELVVDDIARLSEHYGARHVLFADPVLAPHRAKVTANLLFSSGIAVTWGGFARLETGFTTEVLRQMAASGCTLLIWGLETASPRLQQVIRKNAALENVPAILKAAAEAGIHNRVLFMHGLPSETASDIGATIEFLSEQGTLIHSAQCCRYTPERQLNGASVASGSLSLAEPRQNHAPQDTGPCIERLLTLVQAVGHGVRPPPSMTRNAANTEKSRREHDSVRCKCDNRP